MVPRVRSGEGVAIRGGQAGGKAKQSAESNFWNNNDKADGKSRTPNVKPVQRVQGGQPHLPYGSAAKAAAAAADDEEEFI